MLDTLHFLQITMRPCQSSHILHCLFCNVKRAGNYWQVQDPILFLEQPKITTLYGQLVYRFVLHLRTGASLTLPFIVRRVSGR